jgi:hypothetical protein
MATIKVILWCVLILAGIGYWRYAHAEPVRQVAGEYVR